MKGVDGLVLTFLLNALWQIPAAMAAGLLGARLLRRAPSWQRHILWLVVAAACVVLPAASLLRSAPAVDSPAAGVPAAREDGVAGREPFFPAGRRPARYAPGLGAAVVLGYG